MEAPVAHVEVDVVGPRVGVDADADARERAKVRGELAVVDPGQLEIERLAARVVVARRLAARLPVAGDDHERLRVEVVGRLHGEPHEPLVEREHAVRVGGDLREGLDRDRVDGTVRLVKPDLGLRARVRALDVERRERLRPRHLHQRGVGTWRTEGARRLGRRDDRPRAQRRAGPTGGPRAGRDEDQGRAGERPREASSVHRREAYRVPRRPANPARRRAEGRKAPQLYTLAVILRNRREARLP